MNKAEVKAYCEERFEDLTSDNPSWHRTQVVNLIIQELQKEYGVVLTTPTGHSIVGIQENENGLVYHVTDLVREV